MGLDITDEIWKMELSESVNREHDYVVFIYSGDEGAGVELLYLDEEEVKQLLGRVPESEELEE